MGKHESSRCHIKKCDKKFFKIPRKALEELDCTMERLHGDLRDVYREAERAPIAAFREFIRVMNKFSNRTKRINARVFDTLDLNEVIRERHLPIGLLFRTRPISDPPITGATTVFANVATPTVPPLTREQLATIRDILQIAIREVRALLRLQALLSSELLPLSFVSPEIEATLFFINLMIEAAIDEILTRAAVNIINVLLA